MRIGLREANQKFSKLVRAVRSGKEVILTDRGRPVARLTAISADHEEDIIKRLEESGFLRRPIEPGPMPPFKGVRIRGKSIVDTIREMRDEED